MNLPRLYAGAVALCAFAGAAFLYSDTAAHGFDLQEAPVLVKLPSADITDTFLFPSPTNANNVVAVMDVYPGIPAGAGTKTTFDNRLLYTMKFDTNYGSQAVSGGRPVEDVIIQVSFGVASSGSQQVLFYGPQAPVNTGTSTKLATLTGSGLLNKSFSVATTSGNVTVFAGGRRDPAFWDVTKFWSIFPDRNQGSTAQSCLVTGTCALGFNSGAATNYFANTNVLSIVVEMPKTLVAGSGSAIVGYWATTSSSLGL